MKKTARFLSVFTICCALGVAVVFFALGPLSDGGRSDNSALDEKSINNVNVATTPDAHSVASLNNTNLAGDDLAARIVEIKSIGEREGKKGIPRLVPLLRDPCDNVRQAVLETLKKIGPETFAKECILLLQDPDPNVKHSAVEALAELKMPVATKEIVLLLRSEDPWTRAFAAVALGRMGFKEHAKDILPFLKDPDPRVRSAAVNALGELQAREHRENILPLLADSSPEVKEIAQSILERFGKN